jgi:hydroxymethylbilane synthase
MKKDMIPRTAKEVFRLGTRTSRLALQQAQWVKARLEGDHPGIEVRLVHIKTQGDKLDIPLFRVGGKGLFVKEIEEALQRQEVDLAVHSGKDLPAAIPEDLALLAFPLREDPRDVLISRDGKKWAQMPRGGKIGTGSLRRRAQLLAMRPDLEIVPLRGNLDTRIQKIETLGLDGLVVAAAGLRRMGWEDRITEYFAPEQILPAIGQGTLAIEGRRGDERTRLLVEPLNSPDTAKCLGAERSFLARLGGGCQVPIAGWARLEGDLIHLRGLVASPDGRSIIKGERIGPAEDYLTLGQSLAEELLSRGAGEILKEAYGGE